jgi:hypothetical protein
MLSTVINAPYPNRVQLLCAPLTGPFTSAVLGSFDPRRDLQIWLNGDPLAISSFVFDPNNNRYLMYTQAPFLSGNPVVDAASVVQVVHHIPSSPFHDSEGVPQPLDGLASISTYSTQGDGSLPPTISITAVPNPAVHDTAVNLSWTSFNVPNIRITSPGLIGVEFGGNTGYVYTANSLTQLYDPNASTEFWFQTTTTAGGFFVTVCPNQLPPDASLLFGVYMGVDGKIGAGYYNGTTNQLSATTPIAYNDGVLHQCAVTTNGASIIIYIDGAAVVTSFTSGDVGSQPGWWRIANGPGTVGGGWPTISSYLNSFISHVSVWDTVVLTPTQISTHYTALIGGDQTTYEAAVAADSPTSFWYLTEVSGTIAFDSEATNGVTTFDTEESTTGTGTAITTPPLTPAANPEVAIFFMASSYPDVFTPGGGWSNFGTQPPTGTAVADAFYQILNSLTPVSGSATGSASQDWVSSIFAFGLTGNSVSVVQQSGGSGPGPHGLAPTSQGNTILVAVPIVPTVGSPTVTVSDTQFNVYQQIAHVTAGPNSSELDIFITQGIPGGSVNVTINGVGGQGSQYFAIYEIQAHTGHDNGTYASPIDLLLAQSIGGVNSGFLPSVGSGVYPVPSGFASTTVITIGAFDSSFNPIIIGVTPLTAQTTLVVT